MFTNNSIHITNSIVLGAITPNDCDDIVNTSTISIQVATKAIPTVAGEKSDGTEQGRCGIVFPFVAPDNKMPAKPWTGMKQYPSGLLMKVSEITSHFMFLVDGGMFITNTTIAYFNDVCDRHDVGIQVAQHNDDGQFPVFTSAISMFNVSRRNIIFNGRPNLDVVNSARCVGEWKIFTTTI